MEKKYRSIGINAFLNTVKSGMSILFPLITYPYAFRILHASGMGKVDYANSIIGYFSLVAAMGINTYAVREGAKARENREKFEIFASQIFSINIISTILSYVLLLVTLILIPELKAYSILILILSLSIGFTTLGVEWINTIYEDYLYITIRSIITHLLSLVLLFIVVKNEKDYYYYAMLTVLTSATICFLNWYRCRKYVHIRFVKKMNLGLHLKPILMLFANSIATSIYVSADTTMLGVMAGDVSVGLYSIAVKIYSVLKKLLVAMYSVAIPRIAFYWGNGDIPNLKKVYSKMLSNLIIILLPASVGIMSVAQEVILFMGGSEYSESILTLQILSIALIAAILGGTVTYCLNIPIGLEKINLYATIISAFINIIINIFVIPLWHQNGAAISTVISEAFVLVFCIITNKQIKKCIDFSMLKVNILHALIGCFTIIILAGMIHRLVKYNLVSLMLISVLSCICYFCELILMKNNLACTIYRKIKSRI